MIRATIKLGSAGADVKTWQAIVGVTQDGTFGPATRDATIAYQRAHGLVADGIVGSVTWAYALGKKPSKTPTASQPTDKWAYDVAKSAAPGMSEKQRQYVLTVARGEGFYGKGWASPSKTTLEKSAEFGLTGYEGAGSNNWGATMGQGSAGSFPHVDYHANGEAYVGHYRKHNTPEEGFLDVADKVLNGLKRKEVGAKEIQSAIAQGNLRKAVFAQHKNGYFELAPEKYLANVVRNYDILTTNLDWKKLLSETGRWWFPFAIGGIGLAILGYALRSRI